MKKLIVIYISFLITCTSTQRIEKPKDYTSIIKEIEKSEIQPMLKNKIVSTIKEQSNYSNTCYDKILELEERLNKLELENEKLRKENEALRDELATWHKIQFGFWITIIIIALGFVIKLLTPFIKTFVRV